MDCFQNTCTSNAKTRTLKDLVICSVNIENLVLYWFRTGCDVIREGDTYDIAFRIRQYLESFLITPLLLNPSRSPPLWPNELLTRAWYHPSADSHFIEKPLQKQLVQRASVSPLGPMLPSGQESQVWPNTPFAQSHWPVMLLQMLSRVPSKLQSQGRQPNDSE